MQQPLTYGGGRVMSRSYHNRSDGTAGLILLIIIIWAHRAFVDKATHYILLALLMGSAIFLATVIYKLFEGLYFSLYKRRGYSAPLDMLAIDNMTSLEFERQVAWLLQAQGYSAVRLTEEYDYGIDIVAVKDGNTWGIQVKRYTSLVKADAVRQVVTALRKYRCDRAMVITNSTYSQVARVLAQCNECRLIDRSVLSLWVAEQKYLVFE